MIDDTEDYTYAAPVHRLVKASDLDDMRQMRVDLAACVAWMRKAANGMSAADLLRMGEAVQDVGQRWNVAGE